MSHARGGLGVLAGLAPALSAVSQAHRGLGPEAAHCFPMHQGKGRVPGAIIAQGDTGRRLFVLGLPTDIHSFFTAGR